MTRRSQVSCLETAYVQTSSPGALQQIAFTISSAQQWQGMQMPLLYKKHLSVAEAVQAVLQVDCEREAAIAWATLWVHSPDQRCGVIPIQEVVLTATDADI